ncbi:MAG: hypothetical protein B7Z67_13485, partial [Acidiphilium sp. 21-60-14]
MAETDKTLLIVNNVSCGYAGKAVVQNVSFEIGFGEWLGLLGANGSGKSTLLRAISGQIPLKTGSITVCGHDLKRAPEKVKSYIGYAVDGEALPENLTGRQYLELLSSIRGCSPTSWPSGNMVELLDFEGWFDEQIGSYSLGTRMKLSISGALLGCPPLIIFDESLNGLDPVANWKIRNILLKLIKSSRQSIILSTHMIQTVEIVCTRAILLDNQTLSFSWDRKEINDARATERGFEEMIISILNK